jgi:hypothetical protein
MEFSSILIGRRRVEQALRPILQKSSLLLKNARPDKCFLCLLIHLDDLLE